MNILDKLAALPALSGAKKGFMPAKPDAVTALFEYPSAPNHHFSGSDTVEQVQVRVRDKTASAAYARAATIASALNRYHDADISVLQSTSILDIGTDNANPARCEYTVNFTIRRY